MMKNKTLREQVEVYAKKKYKVIPEQLPFNNEDYAIFRHTVSGKWFAVFIVKSRRDFGLEGEGKTEIMSVKIRDPFFADMLLQQPGYLRGFPSAKWHWVSIVLDGTVPFKDICQLLDESFAATLSKPQNKKVPLIKRQ